MSIEFTDHDLDRLADFVAGLLDDSATGAVAQLIRTVPSWAAAYADLVAANSVLSAALRAEARSHPEPMPGDVVASVTAALAEMTDTRSGAVRPTGGAHTRQHAPAPRRPIGAQPAAGRPASTADRAISTRPGLAAVSSLGPARRRKRRLFTGLTAAAAAVVAITAGMTISSGLFTSPDQALTTANRAKGDTAAGAKGAQTAPEFSTATVYLVTGTNYRQETLATAKVIRPTPSHILTTSPVPAVVDNAVPAADLPGRVSPELARLAEPGALVQCLAAISSNHPGAAVSVDYARFNDRPALVVVVRAQTTTTVVAVGPQCGAAGADELASVPA